MDLYCLMHEDVRIADIIVVDNEIFSVTAYACKDIKDRFPVGYTRDSCGIIEFLRSRVLSADRGVDEAFSLMLENHGLSLTDHYWLMKDGEDINWGSVNAYANNFRSSVSFDTDDNDGRNPSFTLAGSLTKKWIIG